MGNNTSFWLDKGLEIHLSKSGSHHIFALRNNKQVVVSDKIAAISLADSLRRAPRGGIEATQFSNLLYLMQTATSQLPLFDLKLTPSCFLLSVALLLNGSNMFPSK
ncbi:hypothetical protein Tco_1113280 [Tanacetum coccineum]|uniref:Uncharacterized protein n=1 Tax=Tanacetum coccineum TaxID=301880 RepID=A0ABQ5IU21_9ASTR